MIDNYIYPWDYDTITEAELKTGISFETGNLYYDDPYFIDWLEDTPFRVEVVAEKLSAPEEKRLVEYRLKVNRMRGNVFTTDNIEEMVTYINGLLGNTISWNEFKDIDWANDYRPMVIELMNPKPFSLQWWVELLARYSYLDDGVLVTVVDKTIDYGELSNYCYYRILKKLGKLNKNTK